MKQSSPFLAALDIGSSKVVFVIASLNKSVNDKQDYSPQNLEVIGVGVVPNSGVRQGVVVDIEATTEAIRRARAEAEMMAGVRVFEAIVAISGSHIKSFDSRGMVAVKSKEVHPVDIDRVIEAAKAVTVPLDRQVLHVIPRQFKLDSQEGILNPVGMVGIRLEVVAHIVTGSQTAIQNNLKCIEKAGLKVSSLVLGQLAAAKSVLSEDEKALGVCVVDIGAGASHLIYFSNSSVSSLNQIALGGQHFTQDIAIGLRTPQSSAEEIKIKKACAMSSLVGEEETLEVEGVGGRKSRVIKKKDLAEIVEPRAEELLTFIGQDIEGAQLSPFLGSGVVLTGGGAHLSGLIDMAEYQFDLPVRLGLPVSLSGLTDGLKSGRFATVVGLLIYGLEQKRFVLAQREGADPMNASFGEITEKVKGFFKDIF